MADDQTISGNDLNIGFMVYTGPSDRVADGPDE
jgi:hypothetical protein